MGAIIRNVNVENLKWSFNIWATKMNTSGNATFCSLMGNNQENVRPLRELLYWLIQQPRHTLPAIGLGIGEKFKDPPGLVKRFRGMCEDLKKELSEMLGEDGVFIYPTHPVPAPYHNQPLSLIFNFAYTAIFNVLGLPSTAVPMGLSKEGVPIGVQVVGNYNNDHLTLAVAQELEDNFGGWVPPY